MKHSRLDRARGTGKVNPGWIFWNDWAGPEERQARYEAMPFTVTSFGVLGRSAVATGVFAMRFRTTNKDQLTAISTTLHSCPGFRQIAIEVVDGVVGMCSVPVTT